MRLAEYLCGRDSIFVVCTRCSHFARFRAVDITIRGGPLSDVDRVLARLVCSNCGAKQAFFQPQRPSVNLHQLERYRKAK